MVADDDPLSGRSFMTLGALNQMGSPPDLILLLGARLGLFTGGRSGMIVPPSARVIQVDIEGSEIGRNRDIDLGIVADCREALVSLSAAVMTDPEVIHPITQMMVASAAPKPEEDNKIRMPYYGERDA